MIDTSAKIQRGELDAAVINDTVGALLKYQDDIARFLVDGRLVVTHLDVDPVAGDALCVTLQEHLG